MSKRFFWEPILPAQQIVERRRESQLITPIAEP